jgi:hypothetical protein
MHVYIHVCLYVHMCESEFLVFQTSLIDLSCLLGLSTVAPPIHQGPAVPTAVIPLPPGTHLLFAQTGKIERLPLEGNSMKKAEAKALLHVPVSAGPGRRLLPRPGGASRA